MRTAGLRLFLAPLANRLAAIAVSCLAALPSMAQAQAAPPEVRQIVTFLFQPGRTADAVAIYERQLKPIYAEVPALVRFRAYREAESPEPLDLVVVSTYSGMAGMDRANESLRRAPSNGQSALALYGLLSSMTQSHHDQFVEMIASLSDSMTDANDLTVFEYTRLVPGAHERFEDLLLTRLRPFEKSRALYQRSDAGRLLIGDEWDYLRTYGIKSLRDWQTYLGEIRQAPFGAELASLVAARKTIILRKDPHLSVR